MDESAKPTFASILAMGFGVLLIGAMLALYIVDKHRGTYLAGLGIGVVCVGAGVFAGRGTKRKSPAGKQQDT